MGSEARFTLQRLDEFLIELILDHAFKMYTKHKHTYSYVWGLLCTCYVVNATHTYTHTHTHMYIIFCNTLQHTATHCITLHHTASHCTTLHHTAIHCQAPSCTARGHTSRHIYKASSLGPHGTREIIFPRMYMCGMTYLHVWHETFSRPSWLDACWGDFVSVFLCLYVCVCVCVCMGGGGGGFC